MTTMYTPFYRQGLLCFPAATIKLLIDSGFDSELAQLAYQGLHLDTDQQLINTINEHLESILPSLDPEIHAELANQDVQFMLADNLNNDESAGV